MRSALFASLAVVAACRLDPEPRPPGELLVVDAPLTGIAFPSRREKVVVPSDGLVVVADAYDDTLSLVAPSGPTRVARLPVGRSPVDVDGPWSLAIDRARGVAYVTLYSPVVFSGTHEGHGHESVPGVVQVLALDDMRQLGDTDVDAEPASIVLSEDGSRVVVLHRYLAGLETALLMPDALDVARARLAVFEPDALASDPKGTSASYVRTCVAPAGLALSRPDGNRAYIACFGEDALGIVDFARDEESTVTLVPIGPTAGPPGAPLLGPLGISLSADGATIAVTSVGAFDVRFFDEASPAFDPARRVALGARPGPPVWSPNGDVVIVPLQFPGGVVAIDPSVPEVVAERMFERGECPLTTQAAFGADGSLLLLCGGVDAGGGHVLSVDPSTFATKGSASVGAFPQSMTLWPGGSR